MLDEELIQRLKDYNYRRKRNIDFVKDKKLESLLCSRYNKVSRIKQHMLFMYHRKKFLYFLTFTFSDKYINKCDRTKKDLIKNCLKDFDEDIYYILNVDYGSQNERQHYHCIVGTDSHCSLKIFLQLTYPCFIWCEEIRFNNNSFKTIPKYINKLTNHAIKKTTRSSRIVFNFKGYGDTTIPEVKEQYIYDKWLVSLT